MKYPDFAVLRLTRDTNTDEIEFDEQALMAVVDAIGETINGPDDVGRVLHHWYNAHRASGGAPDPVAEELFWEAVEETESNFAWDLPVQPPIPQEIKSMRIAHGLTQPQAAALCGVALRTWKGYETPLMSQHSRIPSPAVWGLFLLALDKHPIYKKPMKR